MVSLSLSKNLGLEGLCDMLKVDLKRGLTAADLPERREHFGSNEAKKPEAEGFWAKVWDALQEFMLRVLMVAGSFSIIVDMLVSDAQGRKLGKFQAFLNEIFYGNKIKFNYYCFSLD